MKSCYNLNPKNRDELNDRINCLAPICRLILQFIEYNHNKWIFFFIIFRSKVVVLENVLKVYLNIFLLGISEASPLHQYNLSGDQGDDEVFMVSFIPSTDAILFLIIVT